MTRCAACRRPLEPEEASPPCPQCGAAYHIDCFERVDSCLGACAVTVQDTSFSNPEVFVLAAMGAAGGVYQGALMSPFALGTWALSAMWDPHRSHTRRAPG